MLGRHAAGVDHARLQRAALQFEQLLHGNELIALLCKRGHYALDGEDLTNDKIIRKYGYCGRLKVLDLFNDPANTDLRENMGVAAA